MITLLEYIDLCIDRARRKSNEKPGFFSNISRCRSSLAAYLADRPDAPLVSLADPDFVLSYGRFLFSGEYARRIYADNKPGRRQQFSPKSLEDHLMRLRTVARDAIRQGLMPAMDVFPLVNEDLAREFGLQLRSRSEMTAPSRGSSYRVDAYDFDGEFSRLAQLTFSDLSTRPKVKKAMPQLLYILGMYAYGMEIADLLSLRWDSDSRQLIDDEVVVRHPQMGIDVRLPEKALRLIDVLNGPNPRRGWLIARWPAWPEADPEALATQLSARTAAAIAELGVGLYRQQSIYVDWVCMLRRRVSDLMIILQLLRRDSASIARSIGDITAISDAATDDQGVFLKRWYILCSYATGLDSTEMRSQVADLLADVPDFRKSRDSYDPRVIEKREVRGRVVKRNMPAISRYLFVRCTVDIARRIDKMSPKSSLLRVLGERTRYAVVRHQDIVGLVQFLRDFRDDVELVDIQIPDGYKEFAEGVRIRILSGPLKGQEGTIAQIVKMSKMLESNCNTLKHNKLARGGKYRFLSGASRPQGRALRHRGRWHSLHSRC